MFVSALTALVFPLVQQAFCDTNEPPVVPRPRPVIDPGEERDAAFEKVDALVEVLMLIKSQYVEDKQLDDVVNGAVHGMLQALDPYSDYLDPKQYQHMQEETKGQYGGIGIHIGIKNGFLTVIAPIEDTPAFKAGVQGGDRIVEINGEKTVKMKLEEAVDRLKGMKGTKVKIAVMRAGEETPREFEIERDDIELPSIKGARIIKNGIGYVRITQFSENSGEALVEALDKLMKQDLKALVLDLRNNPGGLLKSAIKVSELFLDKNALIVTTKARKGVSREGGVPSKAGGVRHYVDFPMVALVNAYSASAAEIVAGALQDNKRAVIIGDLTYGKASVQSIIPLKAETNAAIRLTTARYYTPSGRLIHDNGIEPDISVYVPPGEWSQVMTRRAHIENPELFNDEEKKKFENVADRQLDRAIDLLEALKAYNSKKK